MQVAFLVMLEHHADCARLAPTQQVEMRPGTISAFVARWALLRRNQDPHQQQHVLVRPHICYVNMIVAVPC